MDVDTYLRMLGQQGMPGPMPPMPMPPMMGLPPPAMSGPMMGLGPMPSTPYMHAAQLARMKQAADVQARALSLMRAQLEQHMELMKLLEIHEPANPPVPPAPPLEVLAEDPDVLPLGMTLRLAAAGLTPEGLPANYPAKPLPTKNDSRVTGKPAGTKNLTTRGGAAGEEPRGIPAKKQAREDTLRTYLEDLRSKDPRCVFVARRINKLGFKSKSHLQKYFAWYGKVSRVLVAHSKVKASEECTYSRTRPGNFGFVIMSSAEDVQKILAEGQWHTVLGVEIQVHKFEHTQVEKEMQEAELNEAHKQPQGQQQQQQKNGSDGSSGNEDEGDVENMPGGWGRNTTASSMDSSQQSSWGRQSSWGSAASGGSANDSASTVTSVRQALAGKQPSPGSSDLKAGGAEAVPKQVDRQQKKGAVDAARGAVPRPQLSSLAEAESTAPAPGPAGKKALSQQSLLGTLRTHLEELRPMDEECIFVARRINKLGFNSREILNMHFKQYGEVCRVLVAHSKVNTFCDETGKLRFRPGGLGLVVMRNPASVQAILSCEEHIIAGHKISVQCFRRHGPAMQGAIAQRSSDAPGSAHKSEEVGSDGSGPVQHNKSEEGGSSEPCDWTPEGTSNGSGPVPPNKSSEGGSSEPYEKQDPDMEDVASSGALSAAASSGALSGEGAEPSAAAA